MSKVGSLLGFNFIEIPYIWGLGWDLTVPFVSTSLTCSTVEKKSTVPVLICALILPSV